MVENTARRRRERRQNHRRAAILEAAARIFGEVGYENATLEAIGESVGLSKTSLYYYVRSKEDLLASLLASVIGEIGEQARSDLSPDAPAIERLRRFLRAHVEVACRNPNGVLLARHQDIVLGPGHPGTMRAARRRHEEDLEAILESGVREGSLRMADPRMVAYLILGALNGVPRWAAGASPAESAAIADALFDLVVHGLETGRSSRRKRPA